MMLVNDVTFKGNRYSGFQNIMKDLIVMSEAASKDGINKNTTGCRGCASNMGFKGVVHLHQTKVGINDSNTVGHTIQYF